MKLNNALAIAATSLLISVAYAAAPANAPSGTMGMCKDGSYSQSAEKKGACAGHKGVKEWYADEAAPAAPKPSSERAPAPPPPSVAAAPAPRPPAAPTAVAGRTSGSPMQQAAPGGGAGKVWANSNTKVYHCPGAKYYGTTKQGEYMSEADAKTKGYHADHGKACS